MYVGIGRKARRCYGFDEVALVPGEVTVNPNETDPSWEMAGQQINIPILASAMDGVVDVKFAIAFGKLGGLAVLNLEGVQTRYQDPSEVLAEIAAASAEVVSSIPQRAEKFGRIAADAGVDFFVVQSTVTTVQHISTEYETLEFEKFCTQMPVPVIVGNTVSYNVSLALMEAGISGLLVGIGPGAACTTRGVLGIGVPQVSATVDCAAARDMFYRSTGKWIPVITDGGMRTGGDICKALASGADAVMLGSPFARAQEAPGGGFHWGMATPHANLPRGTRVQVGTSGALEEILFGPARVDDGSQNLVGAIKTSMGNVGAHNIREFQHTELIIAPSIGTEGKLLQQVQRVGMGK
jgi:IMP dehydrogenase